MNYYGHPCGLPDSLNFPANFKIYSNYFSSTTKSCVLAAIVFAAESKRGLLPTPHDIIFLAVVGRVRILISQSHNAAAFFIYFKFSAMFLGIVDPLAPFENIACALFMGGIWDAIRYA